MVRRSEEEVEEPDVVALAEQHENAIHCSTHPIRKQLLIAIADESAGELNYVSALAKSCGYERMLVVYHLHKLEEAGLVRCKYKTKNGHTYKHYDMTSLGVKIYGIVSSTNKRSDERK